MGSPKSTAWSFPVRKGGACLGQASGLVVRVVAKSFFRSLEEAPGLGGLHKDEARKGFTWIRCFVGLDDT
jgi:hypothetical protein